MHPSRSFSWTDRQEMFAFIVEVSFSTIFVAAPDGPAAVHAPVVSNAPDRLRFHVSRSNKAIARLTNGRALLSCLGPDAYISPDWYGTADQVPTWNYLTVECEGPLRQLTQDELVAQLDDLSAISERRLAPKIPWTRAKMSDGRFEGLLKAIVGFEMRVEDMRGTYKLGQNKKAEEIAGAAAGLESAGAAEMAALMRAQ